MSELELPLSPNLAFWTLALVDLAGVVTCAWLGVAAVRRHEIGRHRRLMLCAGGLVALFVVAYGFKLLWLGREQLELWSDADVWLLRFHETCVAFMLGGGVTAVTLALRLGLPIENPDAHPDPEGTRARIRLHRRAGRTAVVAATVAMTAAALVLAGMYGRA